MAVHVCHVNGVGIRAARFAVLPEWGGRRRGMGKLVRRLVSWRLSQVGRGETRRSGDQEGEGKVRIGPVVKIRGIRVGGSIRGASTGSRLGAGPGERC